MRDWWRTGVVYQVYPRSFGDADGDGIGDLQGIRERLGNVARLGADAVWLTPFQRSPQADHGYDVSDYCDVDPLFGSLSAFDELLAEAQSLGLRVIVDLVPNHCSIEHPLFRAAVRAGTGSPERERFHFAPGRGADGSEPPNDWPSVFGGSAWTRIREPDGSPGEWYLHLFAPEQPDWNWRNPATHAFFLDVLRFWLGRGVDGVRVDVAHALFKADGLPPLPPGTTIEPMRLRANLLACDQEEVHDVYREWRLLTDAYDPPRVLVGEVNLTAERAARYTRPDELHQAFAFAWLTTPWDAAAWRATGVVLLATARPVTWVVENHDVVRSVTRYGGGERGVARARSAILTVLGLPGAAYPYQGQELTLPEVEVPPAARQDPAWSRSGVTRDGCRVPLPWTVSGDRAHGFSLRDTAGPAWLPQPEGWGSLSVEAQEGDGASTLRLTRTALALRRQLHADGTWSAHDAVAWDVTSDGALVARRGAARLVIAMGTEPAALGSGEVLLASAPLLPDGWLPVDAAAWVIDSPG